MDEKTNVGAGSVSEPEGGRRPTEGSETDGKIFRFWAKHKVDAVMSLMRGETLDALSRELGVTAGVLSQWREDFLVAGAKGLSSRPGKNDAELTRLKAKIGELTMANELLNEKIDRIEQNRPLARRRLKK
jgi:hypothetical protein